MMVVYRAKRKGGPGSTGRPIDLDCAPMADKFKKERKKENIQYKRGMGGRHAATTQGF